MEEQKDTKKLIFETISSIIAEEGVDAVTFSNIARRSFLNKGGIAYYFKGKRDMFRAYYRYFFAQINSGIVQNYIECNRNCDPVEAFCRFVRSEVLDYGFPNEGFARVLRCIHADALKDQIGYDVWKEYLAISIDTYNQMFAQYAEMGILDEERYERTLTAFHLVTCGLMFKLVYSLDMWDTGWHENEITEWLIRSFLKDEYTVPKPSRRAVVRRAKKS